MQAGAHRLEFRIRLRLCDAERAIELVEKIPHHRAVDHIRLGARWVEGQQQQMAAAAAAALEGGLHVGNVQAPCTETRQCRQPLVGRHDVVAGGDALRVLGFAEHRTQQRAGAGGVLSQQCHGTLDEMPRQSPTPSGGIDHKIGQQAAATVTVVLEGDAAEQCAAVVDGDQQMHLRLRRGQLAVQTRRPLRRVLAFGRVGEGPGVQLGERRQQPGVRVSAQIEQVRGGRGHACIPTKGARIIPAGRPVCRDGLSVQPAVARRC